MCIDDSSGQGYPNAPDFSDDDESEEDKEEDEEDEEGTIHHPNACILSHGAQQESLHRRQSQETQENRSACLLRPTSHRPASISQ